MSLLHRARLAARRVGLEVTRYPSEDPVTALLRSGVDTVVDVGANHGHFGQDLRRRGFTGRIVSLEPGAEAFASLQRRASRDAGWTCLNVAAGAEAGELTLHVAANSGASSSVLPMLDAHAAAAPDALYVSSEPVAVVRLDNVAAELGADWGRVGLKLDVQGYEREVLVGCGAWFDQVTAVLIELSTVPLYEGGWLWQEAVDWLRERDFALAGLAPVFVDPATSRLLAFDGLFVRQDR